MQVQTLKISNIGSFSYCEDLERDAGIRFQTGEQGKNNILIGPNGSGKSTVLEVINQVFKVGLSQDYILKQKGSKPHIVPVHHDIQNLTPNYAHTDKPSEIFLELLFTQEDVENLLFIRKFLPRLQTLAKKYADKELSFPDVSKDEVLMQTTLPVWASIPVGESSFSFRHAEDETPMTTFLFAYLQEYELIQMCMNIYNRYEKKSGERQRYPLNNTFALLGAKRQFAQEISSQQHWTDEELDQRIIQSDTKHSHSGGLGYALCKRKIVGLLSHLPSFQDYQRTHTIQDRSKIGKWIGELYHHAFFRDLNDILYRYTRMSLYIYFGKTVVLKGKDSRTGYMFDFAHLGSGEQAFVSLILTVFGYDLRYGLLIIDEPELHLHPQSQKHFLHLLQELTESFGLQSIIATHSPLMVNVNNIYSVLRAQSSPEGTKVITRRQRLAHDEGTLLHMLKYDNIAKMFFVNKIIMVEGETDLIFLRHYLDFLKHTQQWQDTLHSYEIIDIGGKTLFHKRKRLLKKFAIEAYYIGDRDNVLDMIDGASIRGTLSYLYQHKKTLPQKYRITYKTQKYEKLLRYLHDKKPKKWKAYNDVREAQLQENVFLLKRGDLETYLGMTKKGLTETVEFCEHQFQYRLYNKQMQTYRNELDEYIGRIFGV